MLPVLFSYVNLSNPVRVSSAPVVSEKDVRGARKYRVNGSSSRSCSKELALQSLREPDVFRSKGIEGGEIAVSRVSLASGDEDLVET